MMAVTQREQERRAPEPPGERRPVVGIVVVLLVLALAALAVGLYLRSSDTATTVTASPGVTIPAPPTTLAPPALATTGANPDWRALVDSWLAGDYWLKTHPDSSRLVDLYAPDYRVVSASGEVITLASAKADMDMLARGDLRYDPIPAPTTAAAVNMQNRDERSASVFVRFNPKPGNRTVGRDGTVTQFPDEKGAAVIWRMVLGDDGRWRLAGVKPL